MVSRGLLFSYSQIHGNTFQQFPGFMTGTLRFRMAQSRTMELEVTLSRVLY